MVAFWFFTKNKNCRNYKIGRFLGLKILCFGIGVECFDIVFLIGLCYNDEK